MNDKKGENSMKETGKLLVKEILIVAAAVVLGVMALAATYLVPQGK